MKVNEQPAVRYSISQAAELLDRTPSTIRAWDRNKSMPKELRPKRDSNNNRYWDDELIAKIKAWIEENNFHPGSGINYKPSPEDAKKHVHGIRKTMRKIAGNDTDEDRFAATVKTALETMPPDQILAMAPTVAREHYPDMPLEVALGICGRILDQAR